MGGRLRPAEAAVVWLGSNLARYIPGAFWQIGAMGAMAQRRGVSIATTTAASMLVTIVNAITGLVILFAGMALLAFSPGERFTPNARVVAVLVLAVAALALSPLLLPLAARVASRLTGRDIVMPSFTLRAVSVAAAGTAAAWLAYGVAFWLLARAVLPGDLPRPLLGCITLYTASYFAGWFNPMPAGVGAAESVMIILAPGLGVATTAEATVLALFVRAWRTVLEVAPSVVAMLAEPAVGRERIGG